MSENSLPCDNCGEWIAADLIVYTTAPVSGKPIQLCSSCDEEDE